MPNGRGLTPIHIAVSYYLFENVVLLFKDCQEICPEALEPDENGKGVWLSSAMKCLLVPTLFRSIPLAVFHSTLPSSCCFPFHSLTVFHSTLQRFPFHSALQRSYSVPFHLAKVSIPFHLAKVLLCSIPPCKGLTLFHSALRSCENVNMVKFFLSQKQCLPLLLSGHKRDASSRPILPLDVVTSLVVSCVDCVYACVDPLPISQVKHGHNVKSAESAFKQADQFTHDFHVTPKKVAQKC